MKFEEEPIQELGKPQDPRIEKPDPIPRYIDMIRDMCELELFREASGVCTKLKRALVEKAKG